MDVIFLNGPSSSGKSTIAKALQSQLAGYYLHIGIDTFISMMPDKANSLGDETQHADGFYWEKECLEGRDVFRVRKGQYGIQVNDAYRTTVKHLVESGLKVIVDDVADGNEEITLWRDVLKGKDCLFVGVICEESLLEQREKSRGDRKLGSAREQLRRVHKNVEYDMWVDTSKESTDTIALKIGAKVEAQISRENRS
ncbi:putative Chloramphenicol phosphotransferase-like [Vibrio nigripulchritudo SFn27]|uniref:Putative Chloramphenicol phosphotransferase-like n=1 Tax=Vibrio nigripulchritudo TaxID=28173 RepID=U4K8A4_9VIBR|nr:AAA family ATPase [Vibrio nigripulchritudo]CCN82925.1 putative Chloramphenicol phosphotransferase-like [Vibrio nigripulchritudo BLFn1]CCN89602.1 putative Chloramphenicol phosphotransferase-like [Vibrio nigripulchritudo SFn27]CCN94439.1 putative Chloramphenicol phosphotransferase-like [Vibrio nigripulchritudo ENn2]CCO39820.1 putative Chloramphenicol phosphotransferase-like [Vibrio nigripulchritudo SFn135]CCO52266.1 putative Chloramphenicol phosphotransferase-like [Vibrio nigripulchritudo Wn1